MISLHTKQKEIVNSDKRFKMLVWGRRSGKTSVIAYEILKTLWNTEDALVSYYAPTRDDARDIAWSMFKEALKDITVKTNESLLEITVRNFKKGHSVVKLYGWEAVKNREKGRGVENDLVVLDEMAFYPEFNAYFEKVIEPTLLTSKGKLIMATTPNGFNHAYDYSVKAQNDPDWLYSHATSYDNPHNDPRELERLKAQKTPDSFAQEYEADFRKVEGLVFKEFDRFKHVKEMPLEGQKMASIDFGYTDPTSILTIYKTTTDMYYVADELYKSGLVEDDIVSYTKGLEASAVYPDPANPMQIEALRRAQVRVREVVKGKDSIMSGIGKMKDLFVNNKLIISPKCKNLIVELEQYAFDPEKQDTPIGGQDHSIDSLRYCIMMTYFREAMIDPPKPIFNNPMRFNTPQNEEENDSTPIWLQ